MTQKKQDDIIAPSLLMPPSHIAIIMDGNGRWASRRNVPIILGHKEGANVLKRMTRRAASLGVQYLTVFAFSSENWRRPVSWIDEMMGLLRYYLKNEIRELIANNIRLRVIGDKSGFASDIQDLIESAENQTQHNTGINLIIALNYGGRKDILQACKKIAKAMHGPADDPQVLSMAELDALDEELFSSYLYTKDIPDPDLLIRTSGEYRISNFLLWQLAYSEFVITDKLWPDFKEEDLEDAIRQYQSRDRRFGATIAK